MQSRILIVFSAMLVGSHSVLAAEESPTLEQRIGDLERQIKELEATQPSPPARSNLSAFNPAISLILNGTAAGFSQPTNSYALPGFALAEETGPGREGLSLGESELVMSANVDDWFYGRLTAALTRENEVEIEEAYVETAALGAGFNVRGGRFYSNIGYLNSQHPHAWDFVDTALIYRAMLGNQYGDDGLQLRWVAPLDLFLEVGAELFRGESFPAGGAASNGKGSQAYFAHVGGDVGAGHAWRAGVSYMRAEAIDRETGDESNPDIFNGTSRLTGIDFVWKWAPGGNPKQTNFKFQAEYFWQDQDGSFEPSSNGSPLPYQSKQRGWYAQAVYQFVPRWRAGLRYDWLHADNVDAALAGTVLDNQGHTPTRTSVMVDYSHSEFSRLRVQYNRDESHATATDNQWFLQYVMSLGAHGAHRF